MAMEVKVYYRKNKREKPKQIDHIPKCFQLPRSASASKPRTEFYLPICSFKDIKLGPHRSKDIQSSVTVGCSDMSNDGIRGNIDPFSTRSIGPQYRRRKTLTNGLQLPLTDVKLFGQKAHVQPCSNRNNEDKDDLLEFTLYRSKLTEKTTGRKLTQALQYNEHVRRSCKESSTSPEEAVAVNHHDQLTERDNSSSSSRARSKRERKRKVHFDEVSCPLYTSRKVRRFKIMRSLGLAAPVGSPFISS